MVGTLMQEYLHWFDRQMRGRKVVLLLDNFSAHEFGVNALSSYGDIRKIGGPVLENTHILWLPTNATSIYQSLDQSLEEN